MEKDNGIIYTIIITALIAGFIGYFIGSDSTTNNEGIISESQEYQDLKNCAEKLKDNLKEADTALMPLNDDYRAQVRAIEDAKLFTSEISNECDMLK